MATNGLVVMTPTSIAYSGTSASINADGSVSFSAVTSLSLNGVFTGDYDNYMVTVRGNNASGSAEMRLRLRASGTDNTTASSYVSQALSATSTTVSGYRDTQNYAVFSYIYGTQRTGYQCSLYGPYLAQPTAMRVVSSTDDSGARIYDNAMTHNQSVSYDGFTLLLSTGNMTGLVTVFAYNQ